MRGKMQMQDDKFALYLTVFLVFVLGYLFGWVITAATNEIDAIDRGFALYCPSTGDFAWKGECGD
jgi:hypothetical protein